MGLYKLVKGLHNIYNGSLYLFLTNKKNRRCTFGQPAVLVVSDPLLYCDPADGIEHGTGPAPPHAQWHLRPIADTREAGHQDREDEGGTSQWEVFAGLPGSHVHVVQHSGKHRKTHLRRFASDVLCIDQASCVHCGNSSPKIARNA